MLCSNIVWQAIMKTHIIQYKAKLSCSPDAPISWSARKGKAQATYQLAPMQHKNAIHITKTVSAAVGI